MRRVSYSPAAQSDLRQVFVWETQPGSGEAARKRIEALTRAIERLAFSPCRWRLEKDGRRTFMTGRYRVIYRVSQDTNDNDTAGDVLVARILGPGQMS